MIHAAHAPYSVAALPPHPDPLYVVACVNNYNRYRSRGRLYRTFEKHVADSGAILYTIECALGGRPFEVTTPNNPLNVQVRVTDELWHKENLLNLAIARLPQEAKFIATVDADFHFARSDWAHETVQMLERHPVVQMFSSVAYLDSNEELTGSNPGFVEAWMRGAPLRVGDTTIRSDVAYHPRKSGANIGYSSTFGPPGGAWAYRRDALNNLGGLIDSCILGSADFFMALGLIGNVQHRLPSGYSPGLKKTIMDWQDNAVRMLRKDVGVVQGTVFHHWHGGFANRKYDTREQILIKHQFDPNTDLKPNAQGVLTLVDDGTDRFSRLRDDIRSYFTIRNEDQI